MSVSFAKYKKPMASPLMLREQEKWRHRLAADVVKLAEESEGRGAFLEHLSDTLDGIGFEFVKVGSGSTRAVFALPLGTVLKINVAGVKDYAEIRPAANPNAVEMERSRLFPQFVPIVYGEVYRAFGQDRFDQTIDALVCERMVPLADYVWHFTKALGSTTDANLGICPRTGRLMALDVGSAWAESAELSFLKGEHYLQNNLPFLQETRW